MTQVQAAYASGRYDLVKLHPVFATEGGKLLAGMSLYVVVPRHEVFRSGIITGNRFVRETAKQYGDYEDVY